jgi:RNA polymerase sigma-70 factor (ECF subfamily)
MPPADATPPPTLADVPDDALLAPARAGNTAAFTILFHRHYPAIHAFAYRLALCPGAADDIAQDTFVHAARALPGFRGGSSLKNWLYAIAANLARDHHRSRSRRAAREEQFSRLLTDPSAALRDHAATDSAHAAVRDALARLSPDQREAVALVYFENLSHAEAAHVLRCAETTVSWRLFRARTQLKKLLRSPGPAATRHA